LDSFRSPSGDFTGKLPVDYGYFIGILPVDNLPVKFSLGVVARTI